MPKDEILHGLWCACYRTALIPPTGACLPPPPPAAPPRPPTDTALLMTANTPPTTLTTPLTVDVGPQASSFFALRCWWRVSFACLSWVFPLQWLVQKDVRQPCLNLPLWRRSAQQLLCLAGTAGSAPPPPCQLCQTEETD